MKNANEVRFNDLSFLTGNTLDIITVIIIVYGSQTVKTERNRIGKHKEKVGKHKERIERERRITKKKRDWPTQNFVCVF